MELSYEKIRRLEKRIEDNEMFINEAIEAEKQKGDKK